MIDVNETGECRTRACTQVGKRARGARDAEGLAARTGVFEKSFYCEGCLEAAAQRVLSTSIRQIGRIKLGEGTYSRFRPALQPGDEPYGA